MQIRLSAEDVERLGCPEVLEYDEQKLMAREAVALKRATGMSVQRLGELLAGEPCPEHKAQCSKCRRTPCEVHGMGRPCEEHDELVDGCERCKLPCENCGGVDTEALVAMVWIALYRAGVRIPYADFDFDIFAMQTGDGQGNDGSGSTSAGSEIPATT